MRKKDSLQQLEVSADQYEKRLDYISHPNHGDPVEVYEYVSDDGRYIGLQRRFYLSSGRKVFIPLTYGALYGRAGWHDRAMETPYPLYSLKELKIRPESPVMVVEGEKTACAAQRLFPGFVVVTSYGGAKAAGKTDWSALCGREVVIVPDNDSPGQEYSAKVAELLLGIGASCVKTASIGDGFPEGWDLADELPLSMTWSEFRQIVNAAKIVVPEPTGTEAKCQASQRNDTLAAIYLSDRQHLKEGQCSLISWQEKFYGHNGRLYQAIDRADFKADVAKWIIERSKEDLLGTKMRDNLMADIESVCHVKSAATPPCWLKPGKPGTSYTGFHNGILDVERFISGETPYFFPHSLDFFNLSCLPFEFDSAAICPHWCQVLGEIMPDPQTRTLMQEWFGYHLLSGLEFQKMMIFVGEGANGKSVILTVLRAMLGADNVSSVPLEVFDVKRTFPLAETHGKLANIVEEISQIDKAAEGLLKTFVGGGVIQVERKYSHPFNITPTAKLTFATNVLPRFIDRTDGIYRRTLLIQFTEQFKDETKQNKDLVSADYWISSGELPGVLNWALQGAVSLLTKRAFTVPEVSLQALEDYREDNNPARAFLREQFRELPESAYSSKTLYREYREYCESFGYQPLNHQNFAQELKRNFPTVYQAPNPTRSADGRARPWTNLSRRGAWDSSGTHGTEVLNPKSTNNSNVGSRE